MESNIFYSMGGWEVPVNNYDAWRFFKSFDYYCPVNDNCESRGSVVEPFPLGYAEYQRAWHVNMFARALLRSLAFIEEEE